MLFKFLHLTCVFSMIYVLDQQIMSSSDQRSQDCRDSSSAQDSTDDIPRSQNISSSSAQTTLSFQASDAGSSPNPPSSSSRTYVPSYLGGSSSPTSRVLDRNTSGSSQVPAESNVIPSNLLLHNVFTGVNSALGSPLQSISSPVSLDTCTLKLCIIFLISRFESFGYVYYSDSENYATNATVSPPASSSWSSFKFETFIFI